MRHLRVRVKVFFRLDDGFAGNLSNLFSMRYKARRVGLLCIKRARYAMFWRDWRPDAPSTAIPRQTGERIPLRL